MPKEKNIESKYDRKKLFLKTYNYDNLFEKEEWIDKEESTDKKTDMLPL